MKLPFGVVRFCSSPRESGYKLFLFVVRWRRLNIQISVVYRLSPGLYRQTQQATGFSCAFWLALWCQRCDDAHLKAMRQDQSVKVKELGLRGDPKI